MLLLFSGCTHNGAVVPEELPLGTYVMKDAQEELSAPYILIQENDSFVFNYSVLSSYLPVGNYSIEGDRLVLTTEDDENQYVFIIKSDQLIYQKAESSIAQLGESEAVPDGAVFSLDK